MRSNTAQGSWCCGVADQSAQVRVVRIELEAALALAGASHDPLQREASSTGTRPSRGAGLARVQIARLLQIGERRCSAPGPLIPRTASPPKFRAAMRFSKRADRRRGEQDATRASLPGGPPEPRLPISHLDGAGRGIASRAAPAWGCGSDGSGPPAQPDLPDVGGVVREPPPEPEPLSGASQVIPSAMAPAGGAAGAGRAWRANPSARRR